MGCQPHWRRFHVEGLPLCNNWTSLYQYGTESQNYLGQKDKNKITKRTKCSMPCSFMEYRVSISNHIITMVSIGILGGALAGQK